MRSSSSYFGVGGAPFNGTIVCASSRKRWSSSADRTVPISVDIRVAPHDALVAVGIDLDAVAATVLGRLAGDLGRGERMRQRVLPLRNDGHAETAPKCPRSGARARSSSFSKPLRRFSADLLRHRPPSLGQKIAKRSPEMRAASMRGVRLRRITSADAHDDVVADVHAEVLVQHVQAVDVDVNDAIGAVLQ